MELLIDLMTSDHLQQVLAIEKESFFDPWSRRTFIRELKNNRYSLYLIACRGREVAGYTGGWFLSHKLHITNLAVARRYRKQGIGSRLIQELMTMAHLQDCHKVILEVRISNQVAIDLYKKLGFKQLGIKTAYYRNNGEDALIMGKGFDYGAKSR